MQICLLGLEHGDGCLSLLVLRLLRNVVLLHVLLGSTTGMKRRYGSRVGGSSYLPNDIVSELSTDLGGFLCEVLLEVVLLGAEGLDLTVIEAKLLGQRLARLLKPVDLALERGVVRVGVRGGCVSSHHLFLSANIQTYLLAIFFVDKVEERLVLSG